MEPDQRANANLANVLRLRNSVNNQETRRETAKEK